MEKIQPQVESSFVEYSKEIADNITEEGCDKIKEISEKMNVIMKEHDKIRNFFEMKKHYVKYEIFNLENFIHVIDTLIYLHNIVVEHKNREIQIENNSFFGSENPVNKQIIQSHPYIDYISNKNSNEDIDFPPVELIRAKLISLNTQIYLIDIENKTEEEIQLYVDKCIRHNLEYNSLVNLDNPGKPVSNRKIVFMYTFNEELYSELDEKYEFPLKTRYEIINPVIIK